MIENSQFASKIKRNCSARFASRLSFNQIFSPNINKSSKFPIRLLYGQSTVLFEFLLAIWKYANYWKWLRTCFEHNLINFLTERENFKQEIRTWERGVIWIKPYSWCLKRSHIVTVCKFAYQNTQTGSSDSVRLSICLSACLFSSTIEPIPNIFEEFPSTRENLNLIPKYSSSPGQKYHYASIFFKKVNDGHQWGQNAQKDTCVS